MYKYYAKKGNLIKFAKKKEPIGKGIRLVRTHFGASSLFVGFAFQ